MSKLPYIFIGIIFCVNGTAMGLALIMTYPGASPLEYWFGWLLAVGCCFVGVYSLDTARIA